MRITLASVFVDDTGKALKFYTEVLGFVEKTRIPEINWVTVVSPEEPEGTQLLLEPNENPVARAYQKGVFDQGIPATSFAVEDVRREHRRLAELGVDFAVAPTDTKWGTIAVFHDTCGNLIQIHQPMNT